MKKPVQKISLFLGISMFAFGALKFINPFKLWYTTQIVTSDLPFQQFSYWAGQLGEILSGLAFIFLIIFGDKIPKKVKSIGFILINILVAFMMLVAIYIHIHPNVSNDVLPLKIKPPYIPVFFLILTISNVWLNKRKTALNNL